MAPSCRRQSTHTSLRSGPRLPAISTSVCLNLGQQLATLARHTPTSRRSLWHPARPGESATAAIASPHTRVEPSALCRPIDPARLTLHGTAASAATVRCRARCKAARRPRTIPPQTPSKGKLTRGVRGGGRPRRRVGVLSAARHPLADAACMSGARIRCSGRQPACEPVDPAPCPRPESTSSRSASCR